MKLYRSLAPWYRLLTPPDEDYPAEAASLQPLLGGARRVLELGCGGGHLAHHLDDVELTLTDLAPDMLALSRDLNPGAEHVLADMRTLRLGRTFDAVFLHDAVHYLMTEEDLLATIQTARAHLTAGGRFVVLPDFVEESFADMVADGGSDGPDGRGLRYLEWSFREPDGGYAMHFAILLRQPDGTVECVHDVHHFGLFDLPTWLRLLDEAGFDCTIESDAYRAHVFVATAR